MARNDVSSIYHTINKISPVKISEIFMMQLTNQNPTLIKLLVHILRQKSLYTNQALNSIILLP